MSTGETWQTSVTDLDATLQLAAVVGSRLRGGELIELVSDLGGGKTAFVRGLAQGLDSSDQVRSPSFTLRNEYRAGKLTMYHFDFYRLKEAGIMRNELSELLDDPEAVVAVEWADIVEDVLPGRRLTVTIRATGESGRQFVFNYPKELSYLLPVNT
jgi:tRNA threonylcarbamoyladenosine biosynthesis protein TsaE